MESLPRSSHRRKHSTTAANVFSSSFSFKNPYGDVLLSNGGERNSLQVHEYSEIFAGSSSIPVLDLSCLDERVGSGDFRSSKLDYTNIFGGLTHDDVFVPYEEVLNGSAKKAKPRIPVEGQPYPQESGSRHSSRKTGRPPGVASDQSANGVKLQESDSRHSSRKTGRSSGVASDQSIDGVKLQESGSLHPSRKTERPSGVASDQSVDGVKLQESGSLHPSRKTERPSGAASDQSLDGVKIQESGSLHPSRTTEKPSVVASDQSVDGVKPQESGSLHPSRKMERPSGVASDQSVGVMLQESGSLNPSRNMERPSGVPSDQSVDGVEQQFNMSFNMTNQRNSDASDAKTHIAKLHAVPGFAHFVDGCQPHKGKNDSTPLLKREVSRTWSFSAEVEPINTKGGSSFEKSRLNKSHNVNDVNLQSKLSNGPTPSGYPSNQSDNKEPRQLRASFFASKGDVSQKIAGESSEEFDDNSVDAVSAATLKKAIEQAQESIRIAKMIMERKKDGYQDGSKPRPISCLKATDRKTKIDHEALGSKDNSTRKKYEELNPTFPVPAGINGKLTPSLSHSGARIHAENSEGKRVWENVEIDREHEEAFAGRSELFASNHIQSEAIHVDENVVEKLEKNEAAEVQTGAKDFPGCGAADLELAKVGNINGLTPSASELASNLGMLETGKETIQCRNVTADHTKGSEVVPELVQGALSTSQRAQGMEKSVKDDEKCQVTFDCAEGPENNEGRVLNSSQRIPEHGKAVDEASEILRIWQEDRVNEQRENGSIDKEHHEKKLEECDGMVNARSEFNDMLNELCNRAGNESLEQEEIEKEIESVSKWEGGDGKRLATIYDEEISGTGQTEGHLWFGNEEQMKEVLLEVMNDGKPYVFPVGEFTDKVDEAHEPQINDDKQNCAINKDEPELPEEFVQNQVEEEHVRTSKYEATRTLILEANHSAYVQKRETFSEAEKTDNTLRDADRYEDHHNKCQFQEAAYEDDIDEAVNLSSSEASIIFDVAHTNATSNIIAETQEPCNVDSIRKAEEHHKSVKNPEENVPESNEAVSAIDNDKMAEQLFNLQDDEMLRTDYLHRSASEEIFVENKLHDAYEGVSDSRAEASDVMDADPEENLSQDEDVSNTTDIHATAQEHAAEISSQDIHEVLGSHIRIIELVTPDVERVLEQTMESDEGSLSTSSFENTDELSAQESEECVENVRDTASDKEELRGEMISDERKCAEELSEGFYSQLHDEPKEMDNPFKTEAADTDVNMEKDKEKLPGMSPMEERDAKEGVHNFESNDQQKRIEAIKRGREREKDRIAVERAIREARERAFAEVRERAERAAVERAASEVRQRAVSEAREKVEKVSVVKKPVDKASTEAKLRAERAAVERATSEARERALEKAMSMKTSEELRTPADRNSTERFSSSSRNNVLKHSFSSSELETGMNSESAQRRKARLERHQRIMERAAKALAEKNMRDHLAQKEQAERNRFAESLDADIKRWASGKEGNLRALLSTLQYILGPDSGWQPISLTEIITTVAVKKAYRKATLCVHPDKVQQRGANVQQKYICEKVFDLLKAAWNRFNSDER
ncbi:auxin-like 1 protein [Perilla frutescens var. hirtella]|uniref:Auxin-like 1 protein n=1 Tax=Perilla frutescens var. hirtella TaxID=608512 RepID=A0AAD4JIQ6_PERFH|nr:auxin-like 1 protein [Perilla frutescens var. hirtella]